MTHHLPWPRANTFSICAVDPDRGEAGVAVASKALSVGAFVSYAEPGAGAIATQAFTNPSYGPRGLELLRRGLAAEEVVRRLTGEDVTVTEVDSRWVKIFQEEQMAEEGVDFFRDRGRNRIVWMTSRIRQLGVVDRTGRAAAYTGARTFPWAGSRTGEGYSCQGNMLAGEQVVAAMAEVFERERKGARSLTASLFAALNAGDGAGGDKRGKQAAAMLVVRDRGHWTGADQVCDLRVDDHNEPVAELERILRKTRKI